MDTDQWTLTKEIYHTQNRGVVRNLIEQSRKVIAVIHGHTHYSRVDVIKGIPYIDTGNLTNDDGFGDLPVTTQGKWDTIELDKSNRTIRCRREVQVSGTVYTVYDQRVGMGETVYGSPTISAEQVFRSQFASWFGKSAIVSDPVNLYVDNDDYLYKFPVNLYTPDDSIFPRAIRINGRTNSPNFGRARWGFPLTGDRFIFEFSAMAGDTASFAIKIGNRNVTTDPFLYLQFKSNGELVFIRNTTEELLANYVLGQWYHFAFYVIPTPGISQGFNFQFNGVFDGTLYPFYSNPADADVHYFSEMELVTETGDFWIQNPRVRRWESPRRQISFSGVETL